MRQTSDLLLPQMWALQVCSVKLMALRAKQSGALSCNEFPSSDILVSCGQQAAVFLGFAMPAAYTSPEAAVLTKLFARLLADALNELAYPASLAGVVLTVHLAIAPC